MSSRASSVIRLWAAREERSVRPVSKRVRAVRAGISSRPSRLTRLDPPIRRRSSFFRWVKPLKSLPSIRMSRFSSRSAGRRKSSEVFTLALERVSCLSPWKQIRPMLPALPPPNSTDTVTRSSPASSKATPISWALVSRSPAPMARPRTACRSFRVMFPAVRPSVSSIAWHRGESGISSERGVSANWDRSS